MSNIQVRHNANNMQADKHGQRPKKRSLSTNSSHNINKNKPASTLKRYKVLLTCVVCNGDAHGNLKNNSLFKFVFQLFRL
jgi:ribosomal protein L44E